MSEHKYYTTVGLEVHAELKTNTKMFCACKNDPDEERPNVNVCQVCMGHPGTLPTVNYEAVRHVLRVGVAVGGTLPDFTEFDRKNYFYPDIPKGYQISQYKYPLVSGGNLAGVALTRIHLEEDTGTSKHDQGDFSLVDYNRSSVPLMELVTEPVIHSAEEAVMFAKELQLLLRTLGAGEANMEKGEMRVEANISVSTDPNTFGTKVEVKNLNSFRAVGKAIEYEVERHIRMIEKGEKIVQETRGWDENKESTFSQRKKEDSHDYRYFPEPDIPKLWLSEIPEFSRDVLQKSLPELPWIKRERYVKHYKIKATDAENYVQNFLLGDFFEKVISLTKVTHVVSEIRDGVTQSKDVVDVVLVQMISNYIISDLVGLLNKNPEYSLPSAENFAELMKMTYQKEISSRGAKDILLLMLRTKENPSILADMNNLRQKSDPEALKKIIDAVLVAEAKAVTEYKAGKIANLQYLIGKAMKESKGSANPAVLKELFESVLK